MSLEARPATTQDLPQLTGLQRAWDTEWLGAPEHDEDEVRASFDRVEPLDVRSRVLLDDERIVAAAWWWQPAETTVLIDPTVDAAPVYDDLLPWIARSGGVLVESLSADLVLLAALSRHGWTHELSQFELLRDTAPLPPVSWPTGVITTGLEDHADVVHRVIYEEAAWADVPGHSARDRAEWRSLFVEGVDPDQQVLAWRDDRLVGVALGKIFSDGTGWVSQLAVPRDLQRQGLGRALLNEAFRRRLDGGAGQLGLGVSAANGDALRMYLELGLVIDREWMAHRLLT